MHRERGDGAAQLARDERVARRRVAGRGGGGGGAGGQRRDLERRREAVEPLVALAATAIEKLRMALEPHLKGIKASAQIRLAQAQTAYVEKMKAKDADAVKKELTRLSDMLATAKMAADKKAWMAKRLAILKQM